MQTIDTHPEFVTASFVTAAFDACAAFVAPADASPQCGACGWLDTEHDVMHDPGHEVAAVHVLARRRPAPVRSKRLAS